MQVYCDTTQAKADCMDSQNPCKGILQADGIGSVSLSVCCANNWWVHPQYGLLQLQNSGPQQRRQETTVGGGGGRPDQGHGRPAVGTWYTGGADLQTR